MLTPNGLVAFVADGSILPRDSGASDRPMSGSGVVRFRSPEEMRMNFKLPSGREVTGMGIRRGITLIVGGGELQRQPPAELSHLQVSMANQLCSRHSRLGCTTTACKYAAVSPGKLAVQR